jgi:hypothetical protein
VDKPVDSAAETPQPSAAGAFRSQRVYFRIRVDQRGATRDDTLKLNTDLSGNYTPQSGAHPTKVMIERCALERTRSGDGRIGATTWVGNWKVTGDNDERVLHSLDPTVSLDRVPVLIILPEGMWNNPLGGRIRESGYLKVMPLPAEQAPAN